MLDPPEHERQSHRQASQLTFSLSYMVRIAMIRPPAPESSTMAGACPEWELVLHAFFDGELDVADSLTCELHLGRCPRCSGEMKKLKFIRRKLKRSAIGWAAPRASRDRIG
jgi:hypothetical protein